MELTRVQQWVAASLLLAVVGLGISAPMAYASVLMVDDADGRDNAIGIWVLSVVFGVLAVEGSWLLLGHRAVSPWLLLGALPGLIAALWLF